MCKVQLKNARLRPFALFMALFLMNVSWALLQDVYRVNQANR